MNLLIQKKIKKLLLISYATLVPVVITACGGDESDSDEYRPLIFTSGSSASVSENSTDTGYTATATSNNQGITFSIVGGEDKDQFTIDNHSGLLVFNSEVDFELPMDADKNNEYALAIEAADIDGRKVTQNVVITVQNINEAPRFISDTVATTLENSVSTSYVAEAEDEEGSIIQYSLQPSNDADLFEIDSDSGVLSFKVAPDFEAPKDENQDNIYALEVIADDGEGESVMQAMNVEVLDESMLSLEITFPTPNADLIGSTPHITVAGLLTDAEDGLVEVDDLASMTVNGVDAEIVEGAIARWSALVPVSADMVDISVNAQPANAGELLVATTTVANKPILHNYLDIIYDNTKNQVLFFNHDVQGLVSIALDSGERSILSSPEVGEGPELVVGYGDVTSIALDAEHNRVLVMSSNGDCCPNVDIILAVDLDSGNRTLLDSGSFYTFHGKVVPAGEFKAFVINEAYSLKENGEDIYFSGSVSEVNFQTGIKTVISGDTKGSGPTIDDVEGVAYDSETNRLVISDDVLIEINIETGDRSILSGGTVGAGVALKHAKNVKLDVKHDRAIVFDSTEKSFISVSLSTGYREVISSSEDNTGPDFSFFSRFDLDLDNDRILAENEWDIIAVDLMTGERETVFHDEIAEGAFLDFPTDLAFNPSNNTLLVATNSENLLTEVSLETGQRHVIPVSDFYEEGDFTYSLDMFLEPELNTVFFSNSKHDSLASVNLDTGEIIEISSPEKGIGESFEQTNCLYVDVSLNKALVCDNYNEKILQIELDTGNREVLINYEDWEGSVTDLIPDFENNRLLTSGKKLREVDLDTGEVTEFLEGKILHTDKLYVSSEKDVMYSIDIENLVEIDLSNDSVNSIAGRDIGHGPQIFGANDVWVDHDKNRAYVTTTRYDAIMVVDLISGDRAIFSK